VSVAAAVLAAGRGSRFEGGSPKPLATLGGRPLVAWAIDAALTSRLAPVLLVVAPDAADVGGVAPDDVQVTIAEDAGKGIAHSLRAALEALDEDAAVEAVCVGLADQPLVGAAAYRRLAAAYDAEGPQLLVATYDGVRANPVLIGRRLWVAARRLTGDIGARALMAAHDVEEVDCSGTGSPRDVDTLDDLHALEQELDQG
jgi:molybdenum cofactor cytidylyltransferase/nicotine blue oxidoreductase